VWLRIAAGGLAFFTFGHTMDMLAPTRGAEEEAALGALRAFRFDVMGVTRSHEDFYVGLGWCLVLALAVFTGMTLWLAGLSERSPRDAAPGVVGLAVFSVVSTALCARWFFAAPGVASLFAGVCCVMAIRQLRRGEA
jgi:hypothetical protein